MQGRKKRESAAAPAPQAPAVSAEQAAELVAEEHSRQQALQKALQAVMRLEAALSTSSATMVGPRPSNHTHHISRVKYLSIDIPQAKLPREAAYFQG